MPLDLEPAPGATFRVLGDGRAIYAPAIDRLDPSDDGTRYASHFATCPQAAEHRKAKR